MTKKKIKLMSFGYKYGVPSGYGVVDCRELSNPHHNPLLRALTGKDEAVQAFMRADHRFNTLMDVVAESPDIFIDTDEEGLAFGCIGGRHRSVAIVEILAGKLKDQGYDVTVTHRELD